MLQVSAHGTVERRSDSTSSRARPWRGETAFTAWISTFVSTTNIAVVHHLVKSRTGIDRSKKLAAPGRGEGRQVVRRRPLLHQCHANQVLRSPGGRNAATTRICLELAHHGVVEDKRRLHPYYRTSVDVLPSNVGTETTSRR